MDRMIIKKQRHNEQLVMRQIARQDEDKLYLCVSSPTIKDKPVSKRNINKESKISNKGISSSCIFQVQIRPWKLSDADFVLDATLPLDPRKTVFVGGVPRPLKVQKRDNYYHHDDCDDLDAPGWKTSRMVKDGL